MEIKFRPLKFNEIECRVNQISDKGLTLLLYKDARCDMNILDETIGVMNWQREHKELKGNIYCGVSIYNKDINQWTTKWDSGKESNTEAVKGEASDSFKRACVNWGIGRELYTAPFIWIPNDRCEIKKNDKGKYYTTTKFRVGNISYDEKRNINGIIIINEKKEVVFKIEPPKKEVQNENNK